MVYRCRPCIHGKIIPKKWFCLLDRLHAADVYSDKVTWLWQGAHISWNGQYQNLTACKGSLPCHYKSGSVDAIIISDANTLAIINKRILEANGMMEMFKDVISNPAFLTAKAY